MTNDQGLLQTVIEQPDDDTPRLIYADWLEEQGQAERAEFIRVQCALARLDWGRRRDSPLYAREVQLWNQHGKQWLAPLQGKAEQARFWRGFVNFVSLNTDQFQNHANEIFQQHPVRDLRVMTQQVEMVISSPHLARLARLDLSHDLQSYWDETAEIMLNTPALLSLQKLQVPWWTLSDAMQERLRQHFGARLD